MLRELLDRNGFETTTEFCAQALLQPGLRPSYELLHAKGYGPSQLRELVAGVSENPSSVEPLEKLQRETDTEGTGAFQRVVLLNAAIASIQVLPHLPVSDDVKAHFCDEFRFFASMPGEHASRFEIGSASFAGMCKTATLRRFPAGQFDWEVGGISRSDIAAVSFTRLLPTIFFATFRMRGLFPVFFSHLSWRRPNRSLDELEANRSYYRMAQAMKLQPAIKGFAACSWFRSPGVHRVSPHLAWLSTVVLENGGFVVEAGEDTPDSGVLHRSRKRKELYEARKFRPTKGLVMWPRDAMVAWAAAHPELETPPGQR